LKTLVPDGTLQDVDTPTWTFEVTGVQGDTLALYLNAHAGEEVSVVFVPKPDGTSAAFSMIATAIPFGGDQGAYATFDASFPVSVVPVFTEPD